MVVEAATQYQPTIRDLPQGERPRERLREFGPKSLNDTELIAILLLNTRNEVLGIQEIYVGNVNSSVVRAAEVFRPAVQANAPSIIVVRNHPSGDPAPSSQDVDVTNELISAGKLLGIELLDHVVLGRGNRFVSMNERRFAFT